MFQTGDQVVYGAHGVCCVVDTEARMVDGKRLRYLVLEPVARDGSRYLVPTHNPAAIGKLRKMLLPQEMESLMDSEQVHKDSWIRDENVRKQTYRELIGSGDRASLMQMVRTLYRHKANQIAAGKKMHQCDDNFLRDAEKLLSSEVSVVMNMEYEQARTFLREKLSRE